MTAALCDHLSKQAEACEALGSPFTARLLRVVLDNLGPGTAVADRLLTWPEATLRADAVGLRLTGGLHALVLSEAAPQLAALYPASEDDAALWSAITDAFETHSAHLLHWLDNAPQTNEVRRAPAMILAASEAAKQFPGLPLRVSELGASAGLNLLFDRFALDLPQGPYTPPNAVMMLRPDWQGQPADIVPFSVAERRGVDLNPLSPDQPADMLRLRSYLWADQPERMQRTNAALSIATPYGRRWGCGPLAGRAARHAQPWHACVCLPHGCLAVFSRTHQSRLRRGADHGRLTRNAGNSAGLSDI